MKRYKLLKDLAGLEAGSTLYLDELGNLVASDKTTIVFLANFIHHYNLLDSDWFEEIPEDHRRWRAKEDERYWCVQDDGGVAEACDDWIDIDDGRYELGNYFKTEEEAQKAADWLKAFTILRDDTKGFKPDWKNEDQDKWSVEYGYDGVQLVAECYRFTQNGVIYFATAEDAEKSIETHERQWLTYLRVEE